MDLSLFDYELPKELIAQEPAPERAGSRLMVLNGSDRTDTHFHELPEFLEPGDILILNDTKVMPARLWGTKRTGGKVEVLLVSSVGGRRWRAIIGAKRLKPGQEIMLDGSGTIITPIEREDDTWTIEFPPGTDVRALQYEIGEMPTPPYIKKRPEDPSRYQTVFAEKEGSIAAPTAGLHFTKELLADIRSMNVGIAYLTLNVGPGTFMPVRSERVEEHMMEGELATINQEVVDQIAATKENGGRVIAVGTTTVRSLEGAVARFGCLRAGRFWTEIFIYPGWVFSSGIDGMLTNFHLPCSTLIMLVSAFYGRERILEAYTHAIEEGYRFYSFGDAMLLLGGKGV